MAYNHGYYSAPTPVAPVYPAYGAPALQPAYAAYAPPPPPPPPPPAKPSEAFRHFFRSHLATLTFNSRPVINHLTQLALDQTANFENAVVVSEEIAKGIFEVSSRCPSRSGRSRQACMRKGVCKCWTGEAVIARSPMLCAAPVSSGVLPDLFVVSHACRLLSRRPASSLSLLTSSCL